MKRLSAALIFRFVLFLGTRQRRLANCLISISEASKWQRTSCTFDIVRFPSRRRQVGFVLHRLAPPSDWAANNEVTFPLDTTKGRRSRDDAMRSIRTKGAFGNLVLNGAAPSQVHSWISKSEWLSATSAKVCMMPTETPLWDCFSVCLRPNNPFLLPIHPDGKGMSTLLVEVIRMTFR